MNCMSYIIVFYNFTFIGVITNQIVQTERNYTVFQLIGYYHIGKEVE